MGLTEYAICGMRHWVCSMRYGAH